MVSPEHVDWLKEIHNYCTTPLSHGELYINPNEWQNAVVNHSIDYLWAHISDIGSVTPALRMAVFSNQLGARTCWHTAARYSCEHPVTLWTQTRNPDGSLQTP